MFPQDARPARQTISTTDRETEDRRHGTAVHTQLNANLSPGIAGHHLKAFHNCWGTPGTITSHLDFGDWGPAGIWDDWGPPGTWDDCGPPGTWDN